MWNKEYPASDVEVQWRVCNGFFEVKCTADTKYSLQGCHLNILSVKTSGIEKLCLGSFAQKNGNFVVCKTYTAAYLELNNISIEQNFYFEISDTDEKVVCTTYKNSTDTLCSESEPEDFSVVRARNLLDSVKPGNSDSDTAEQVAAMVIDAMNKYERTVLPCFNSFEWVRVQALNESFGLSSAEHIIYEMDFFRAFQQSNEWFFGICDKRLFAVCIRSNSENTPFNNASDCSVMQNDSYGNFYHAVGIALLDDGQYFFKMQ